MSLVALLAMLIPLEFKSGYQDAQNPVPAASACTKVEVDQGGKYKISIRFLGPTILAMVQGREPKWAELSLLTDKTTITQTDAAHTKWTVDAAGNVIDQTPIPEITTTKHVNPIIR